MERALSTAAQRDRQGPPTKEEKKRCSQRLLRASGGRPNGLMCKAALNLTDSLAARTLFAIRDHAHPIYVILPNRRRLEPSAGQPAVALHREG